MNNTIGSTDFRMQYFTIRELMQRMGDELLIGKRVLRKQWNRQKQISFIESVLSGIPIASVYFDGSKPRWTVLDGVERLCAIEDFVNNAFPLKDLNLLSPDYEDKFFRNFPFAVKRRFMNTPVIGYVLTTELSKEVLELIFKRLNGEYEYDA